MIGKLTNFFDRKVSNDLSNEKFKAKKSNKIKVVNTVVNKKLNCTIDVDDIDLYGKEATLKLISRVKVSDSRAVNEQKVLFTKKYTIDSGSNNILINLNKYKNFSYRWTQINIDLFVEVVVDDSIFFDTKITSKIQESLFVKPKVYSSAKALIEPKDNFNLIENIKAIPFDAMAFVFWLSILWWIVILVNTIVWFHDQFVMESQTYFYSHTNSDWESSSPLFNSLSTSWALWAWIWFMIKTQLRRYMSFVFKKTKFLWDRTKLYKVREIVTWKSRVDLNNVRLRIVACNMEKWQYKRWSWTKTRTVSFSNPIRAVSLYDENIDFIPKNTDISEYFKWDVSFEKMYKVLYPEQLISSSHWISIHWEVQLLHDKFIDQELIWGSKFFRYEHFLKW